MYSSLNFLEDFTLKNKNKQKNQPKQQVQPVEVSEEEVAKQVRETLARLTSKGNKIQKLNEGDWMTDFYPVVAGAKEVLVASTSSSIKLTTNDIPIFSKGALGNKSIKMDAKSNVVGIFIY